MRTERAGDAAGLATAHKSGSPVETHMYGKADRGLSHRVSQTTAPLPQNSPHRGFLQPCTSFCLSLLSLSVLSLSVSLSPPTHPLLSVTATEEKTCDLLLPTALSLCHCVTYCQRSPRKHLVLTRPLGPYFSSVCVFSLASGLPGHPKCSHPPENIDPSLTTMCCDLSQGMSQHPLRSVPIYPRCSESAEC